MYSFDYAGNNLPTPQTDYYTAQLVWFGNSKAVALIDNNDTVTNTSNRFTTIYCSGQQKYDVVS